MFNPELFNYLLLPPIIFDAGFRMRRKAFFDNFGSILAFALPGTLAAIFVVAWTMYFFATFVTSPVFRFIDFLYFGAFIAATDPVSTLAIFQVRNNSSTPSEIRAQTN